MSLLLRNPRRLKRPHSRATLAWDPLDAARRFLDGVAKLDSRDQTAQYKKNAPLCFVEGRFNIRTFLLERGVLELLQGRTSRRTEAAFAANHLSSPEKEALPKRFFLVGTSCATTFSRPGSVNSFAPFL
jgi:hypothetical protein